MKDVCSALDITCIEKNIEQYDVYTADEAFITGTPFCMLPVTSLNGLPIGDGKVGPTFTKLLDCWSEKVGVNIADQIRHWDAQNSQHSNALSPYQFKDRK